MFPALHQIHLARAARRGWAVDEESAATLAEVAVGFADLAGFTALASQVSPTELAGIVDAFDEQVGDAVLTNGGQVVKLIGDEVMFVADDIGDGIRIAQTLATGLPGAEGPARRPGRPGRRRGAQPGRRLLRLGREPGRPAGRTWPSPARCCCPRTPLPSAPQVGSRPSIPSTSRASRSRSGLPPPPLRAATAAAVAAVPAAGPGRRPAGPCAGPGDAGAPGRRRRGSWAGRPRPSGGGCRPELTSVGSALPEKLPWNGVTSK